MFVKALKIKKIYHEWLGTIMFCPCGCNLILSKTLYYFIYHVYDGDWKQLTQCVACHKCWPKYRVWVELFLKVKYVKLDTFINLQ